MVFPPFRFVSATGSVIISPMPRQSRRAGDPAQLAFNVADGQGSFTIASLRAANALQQWLERNNIAGYRYGDQIKAQFGIYPADAVTDRAIYLGSHTVDIYNRSVYQQNYSTEASAAGDTTPNPFQTVGSKYGSPQGVGENSLVDHFTASEHGFIFVMFSIVPRAYYGTGDRRYLRYARQSDFAFPLLAGVGDQEIYRSELTNEGSSTAAYSQVFGYTQRFRNISIWMMRSTACYVTVSHLVLLP